MTLEEYTSFIKIDSITVSNLCYKLDKNIARENKTLYYYYSPNFDSVTFSKKEKRVSVEFPFVFSATTDKLEMKEEDNTDLDFFNLQALYSLDLITEKKLTITSSLEDEIIRTFLPRLLQPYFRQLVVEMLVKAGLPPLQLPVYEGMLRKAKEKTK